MTVIHHIRRNDVDHKNIHTPRSKAVKVQVRRVYQIVTVFVLASLFWYGISLYQQMQSYHRRPYEYDGYTDADSDGNDDEEEEEDRRRRPHNGYSDVSHLANPKKETEEGRIRTGPLATAPSSSSTASTTKAKTANEAPLSAVATAPKAWIVQADSTPLQSPLPPPPPSMNNNNNNNSTMTKTISTTSDATSLESVATDWMNLMSSLNVWYAEKHRYGYTRYTFDQEDNKACMYYTQRHNHTRHIAWCKLLAIAKVLRDVVPAHEGLQYVVWIDSDAMVQHQRWSIPDIVDRIPSGCSAASACPTEACRRHRRSAALLTAANQPFCGEPALTAFQVWNLYASDDIGMDGIGIGDGGGKDGNRVVNEDEEAGGSTSTGRRAMRILRDWWNSKRCAWEHPWEQRAFSRDVYTKYALGFHGNQKNGSSSTGAAGGGGGGGGGIAILYQDVNHPSLPEHVLREQAFLRHVGHTAGMKNGRPEQLEGGKSARLLHALNVAEYLNFTSTEYQRIQAKLHRHDQGRNNQQNHPLQQTLTPRDLEGLSRSLWDGTEIADDGTEFGVDCTYVPNPVRNPPATS